MMNHRIGWLPVALTLAGALSLTGCNQYVNIPSLAGSTATDNPNYANVEVVITASLQSVLADQPIAGPVQLVLPPDTDAQRAGAIARNIGVPAVPTTQPLTGQPRLEVAQVRIRSWRAQVDIIRPIDPKKPDGLQQLVSCDLDWFISRGWYVNQLRVWHMPVDQALMKALSQDIEATPVNLPEHPRNK